jgi:hypothetical protein
MATVIVEFYCAFFVGKRLNAKDVHKDMFPVHGEKCMSRKAVRNWGQQRQLVQGDSMQGGGKCPRGRFFLIVKKNIVNTKKAYAMPIRPSVAHSYKHLILYITAVSPRFLI